MRLAWFVGCAAVLFLPACGVVDPAGDNGNQTAPDGSRSIAGTYTLEQVDGLPLPCCAATDSTGDVVTIVGGTLKLGDAAPQEFVFTPSGYSMAKSCVHQIPNGAVVDTGNVVHLPDGSSYRIPPCGDAPYTFTIAERHERGGATRWVSAVDSGKYVWGGRQITLVANASAPGRIGDLIDAAGGLSISLQHYESFPPTAKGHRYDFGGRPQ